MPRKKVALRYIRNDSARSNTLKKRSKNLMKKASEVATLCNAKALVLVYGEGATVPEVFPSHAEAVDILNRFKSMPEVAQLKKTVDQETILSQRIAKLRDQVQKTRREREDREARILLHKAMVSGHLPGNIEELTTIGWKLELIHKSLGERIAKISGQPPVYQDQAPYITGNMNMESPAMYQAPYITGNMNMESPAMYQAPYSTGNMDMGSPAMYQAPPHQQEGWVDTARFEGDPGAQIYNGHSTGGHIVTSAGFSHAYMNM